MIIYPSIDEKKAPLDAGSFRPKNTSDSHVFFATVPGTDLPSSEERDRVDDGDLASLLHDNLNIKDAPPAYDALSLGETYNESVPREGPSSAPVHPADRPSSASARSTPTPPLARAPSSPPRARGLYVPSTEAPNASFPPLVIHSKGKRLEEGFYNTLPPTDVEPHPFAQRNITKADWKKFLDDIQSSARLAASDSRSPQPLVMSGGIIRNVMRSLSATATENQREPGSRNSLGALIDTWNENFFHPRGLEVVLAKGSRRLSGNLALPPPDSMPSVHFNESPTSRASPSMSPMPRMHSMPPMPPMPGMASPKFYPRSNRFPIPTRKGSGCGRGRGRGQNIRGPGSGPSADHYAYFDSASAHWQPADEQNNRKRRSQSVSTSSSSSSSLSSSSSSSSDADADDAKKSKKDKDRSRGTQPQPPSQASQASQAYPSLNPAAGPSGSHGRG
ncbi:hypothetical protein EW145_g7963, partial [Phellinidium pouzarii]